MNHDFRREKRAARVETLKAVGCSGLVLLVMVVIYTAMCVLFGGCAGKGSKAEGKDLFAMMRGADGETIGGRGSLGTASPTLTETVGGRGSLGTASPTLASPALMSPALMSPALMSPALAVQPVVYRTNVLMLPGTRWAYNWSVEESGDLRSWRTVLSNLDAGTDWTLILPKGETGGFFRAKGMP